ncbi:TPA: DUF2247 family protein [Clostridium botulinum]|uniref:DUF2247 family protein n=1 Tax=Clostridium botulinum TaxID=1491 RepID=UPI0033082649|nr:DUF2247 family protein [Clostridium botulinum]
MIEFEQFRKNKISINWTTIIIGWYGPGKFIRQLNEKDIINYAINLIVNDDNQQEEVLMLASCTEKDCCEIEELINKLANKEKVNKEIEERKWQVILLMNLLNNLNNSPTYGLIEITEFWEKFSYPENSPHVVQGLKNSISPFEYYSKENFAIIINMHKQWIKSQLEELNKL